MIVERHGLGRGGEYHRASNEILRRRTGKLGSRGCALRDRHVPGRLDEFRELPVGDLDSIHPETVHPDAVDRTSVGHRIGTAVGQLSGIGAPHRELAARNQDHARRRRKGWLGNLGFR